jgi:hypothetical protein
MDVRVRNTGPVSGAGVISFAALDSLGNVLLEVPLANGQPVHIEPAELGGAHGVVVPSPADDAFRSLLDSLLMTGSTFGLRARIATMAAMQTKLTTRQRANGRSHSPSNRVPPRDSALASACPKGTTR